jgi:hypothetical protein
LYLRGRAQGAKFLHTLCYRDFLAPVTDREFCLIGLILHMWKWTPTDVDDLKCHAKIKQELPSPRAFQNYPPASPVLSLGVGAHGK